VKKTKNGFFLPKMKGKTPNYVPRRKKEYKEKSKKNANLKA
jgi:hypothetical protein